MDKKALIENIEKLLEKKLEEPNFTDCFLVEIKMPATNKLEVFMDSDTGITFRKCQQISRYLEAVLDEEKWMGEKYTLEVSSPGVGRPLKIRRQYPKNIGRKIEIKLSDGGKVKGTLTAVNENDITIEDKVRVKEGKKKKTQLVATVVPFENIEQTIVKISF